MAVATPVAQMPDQNAAQFWTQNGQDSVFNQTAYNSAMSAYNAQQLGQYAWITDPNGMAAPTYNPTTAGNAESGQMPGQNGLSQSAIAGAAWRLANAQGFVGSGVIPGAVTGAGDAQSQDPSMVNQGLVDWMQKQGDTIGLSQTGSGGWTGASNTNYNLLNSAGKSLGGFTANDGTSMRDVATMVAGGAGMYFGASALMGAGGGAAAGSSAIPDLTAAEMTAPSVGVLGSTGAGATADVAGGAAASFGANAADPYLLTGGGALTSGAAAGAGGAAPTFAGLGATSYGTGGALTDLGTALSGAGAAAGGSGGAGSLVEKIGSTLGNMNLGQWAQLGSSLYGLYQGNKMQGMAQGANPMSPYASGLAGQLNQLLTNPSSITGMPGYQQGMDSALQALQRTSASQGLTGSGQTSAAIAQLGATYPMQFLQQQEGALGSALGLNAQGSTNQMKGYAAGADTQNQAIDNLMKMFYTQNGG